MLVIIKMPAALTLFALPWLIILFYALKEGVLDEELYNRLHFYSNIFLFNNSDLPARESGRREYE